jgi:hypothetical protein
MALVPQALAQDCASHSRIAGTALVHSGSSACAVHMTDAAASKTPPWHSQAMRSRQALSALASWEAHALSTHAMHAGLPPVPCAKHALSPPLLLPLPEPPATLFEPLALAPAPETLPPQAATRTKTTREATRVDTRAMVPARGRMPCHPNVQQ